MNDLCSFQRFKITCSNKPGITRVLTDRPNGVCPICFNPLQDKGSCAVIKEMAWQKPPPQKKNGPNICGPSDAMRRLPEKGSYRRKRIQY